MKCFTCHAGKGDFILQPMESNWWILCSKPHALYFRKVTLSMVRGTDLRVLSYGQWLYTGRIVTGDVKDDGSLTKKVGTSDWRMGCEFVDIQALFLGIDLRETREGKNSFKGTSRIQLEWQGGWWWYLNSDNQYKKKKLGVKQGWEDDKFSWRNVLFEQLIGCPSENV